MFKFFKGGILGIYTVNPMRANILPSMSILGWFSAAGEAPGYNITTRFVIFFGKIIFTGVSSLFNPVYFRNFILYKGGLFSLYKKMEEINLNDL